MPSANLLFLLACWISFSAVYTERSTQDTYSDGLSPPANVCANCSVCQYPCHVQPPPPPSGLPSGAAPPPPHGLPSGVAPPPPQPPAQVANCPPSGPPVGCCQSQNSPPMPYFYNPYNKSGPVSMELGIKPSTSTWLSAVFFISIMMQA